MINLLNANKREIKDDEDNIIGYTLQNEQPRYNIDKNYASSKNNNTISCIYTLNDVTYTTEKVLNFGVAGTKGTEQTLVVNFANSDTNAIDLDNSARKVYEVIVQLYDASGQTIMDLNNITWSFYKNTHNYLELNKINNQICELTILNGLGHEQLYILKVEVGDLETYFNIPLKSSNLCDYIDGPTQIIYQANGEPDFYNYPYRIYNDGDEIKESIYWDIISTDSSNNKNGNYDATIQNNKLNPIKTYVKDAPLYGVKCYSGSNIVWTQPILVIQNRWSSNVINKWDGKTIEIDNGTGTILSQALAAGTKNSDNEFSGVMIGEWKHTDSNQKTFNQTGVYGFHEGAMSYAFMDDGTGFIGKDGLGRINFNGNKATIYSTSYKIDPNNNITTQRPTGSMTIDLNDPYILMQHEDNTIRIDASKTGTVTSASSSNAPFKIGNKFAVAWDGTIYASGGNFSGHINAYTGTIGGWKITSDKLTSSNGDVTLYESGDIEGASISGGVISGTTIYSEEIYAGVSNGYKYAKQIRETPQDNVWIHETYVTLTKNRGEIYYPTGNSSEALVRYVYQEAVNGTNIARLGNFLGAIDSNNSTVVAGIQTTDTYPLVLETNSASIRITAKNNTLYLQGQYLSCTIPKENQTGIYARFA